MIEPSNFGMEDVGRDKFDQSKVGLRFPAFDACGTVVYASMPGFKQMKASSILSRIAASSVSGFFW